MLKLAGFFCSQPWCVWMTQYRKPPLSLQAQLEQLQARGLAICDVDAAERYLQRVGYYRLMGYLYPQRIAGSDNFRQGATFEDSVQLYEFDCALRDMVMEAIGHVEIAVRTSVAYHFSHAHGAFGYLAENNLSCTSAQHQSWLEAVFKEVERSKEAFILHYQSKYTQPAFPRVPIWMATEIMSLGSLSRLYGAMRGSEQKAISREFGIAAPVLQNWLHVTSVVRNVVAHHGRLWNKELGVAAIRPRASGWSEPEAPFLTGRLFFVLLLLRKLLQGTTADAQDWRDRAHALLKDSLINEERVRGLGAGPDWDGHRLWRS